MACRAAFKPMHVKLDSTGAKPASFCREFPLRMKVLHFLNYRNLEKYMYYLCKKCELHKYLLNNYIKYLFEIQINGIFC